MSLNAKKLDSLESLTTMVFCKNSARQIPKKTNVTLHLAPPRADYEQAFAGANFNTEKISGAHVEVSGAHFKVLAIIKVSGAPLKAPLKSPEHNLMK